MLEADQISTIQYQIYWTTGSRFQCIHRRPSWNVRRSTAPDQRWYFPWRSSSRSCRHEKGIDLSRCPKRVAASWTGFLTSPSSVSSVSKAIFRRPASSSAFALKSKKLSSFSIGTKSPKFTKFVSLNSSMTFLAEPGDPNVIADAERTRSLDAYRDWSASWSQNVGTRTWVCGRGFTYVCNRESVFPLLANNGCADVDIIFSSCLDVVGQGCRVALIALAEHSVEIGIAQREESIC